MRFILLNILAAGARQPETLLSHVVVSLLVPLAATVMDSKYRAFIAGMSDLGAV